MKREKLKKQEKQNTKYIYLELHDINYIRN